MSGNEGGKRELLRHVVATLAYRAGKAIRAAPSGFGVFPSAEKTRTPGEILAHIGDLLDWAFHLAQGQHVWKESPPQEWDQEVDRFFAALRRLEDYLASDQPLGSPAERLFQGPLADALTHVGQISLLRRQAGSPVKGENYFKADIAAGRVGADQPVPRVEFD